ncbi:MAG: UDP-N-acetyl-2-amino-2-deoxyglucuronate dehydrogenase [Chthoniobacter sp.]|jgi:predicted dehydrogenase|nr:UDP-N-acetyl-2-amino-2-deoxyglucuronate dehydrogenase [Chthoniobacter sp.]
MSPSSDPIGFAIIGTGMIAEFHANAIRAVPGAKLIGAYGNVPEQRHAFCEKFGLREYESLEAVIADPEIAATTVATPSGLHAAVAVPVLEAGKAVLCEKPIDVTLEAVDAILAAEKRGNGRLACVFQSRFGAGAQALKAAVEAGRFGRLTMCSAYVKWWRDQSYYGTSGWKGTWKIDGGGALMNQGVHAVDLLQWLAGLPEEVSAFHATLAHTMEAEDTLTALLRFPSGALGVIEAATSTWPGDDLQIEIDGDKGSATIVNDKVTRWDFAEKQPGDEAVLRNEGAGKIGGGAADPKAIPIEGHRRLIEDLVNAIREGRAPMIPGTDARGAIALIRACYESAATRSVVKVSR